MVQIIQNVWTYLSFPYSLLLILFPFFLLSFLSCPCMNMCIILMWLYEVYRYLLLVNCNLKWFMFFLEFCQCDLHTPFLINLCFVFCNIICN